MVPLPCKKGCGGAKKIEQPRLIDFQEFWSDPVVTMEEFCLCLERVDFLLRGIKDAGTADRCATELVEVVAQVEKAALCC